MAGKTKRIAANHLRADCYNNPRGHVGRPYGDAVAVLEPVGEKRLRGRENFLLKGGIGERGTVFAFDGDRIGRAFGSAPKRLRYGIGEW